MCFFFMFQEESEQYFRRKKTLSFEALNNPSKSKYTRLYMDYKCFNKVLLLYNI